MKKLCLILALGLLSSCGFRCEGDVAANVMGYGLTASLQQDISIEAKSDLGTKS